ncbi:hypothetical protein Oweho_3236 [Owenweeksia hongkongensis DSM 17368]|uniref:Uncharacterized protein n=1 Tax=Owenweeksia hongkongensis (strain DSM 17368 / CIP 108786 / JCM 12287 / NRRL B-23963 / UST20020801) TaxID=926562 RepID=G8R487_OWEHD|nr:hypothetical protein [Owenweeksia hongkongensis]AEV34187.1 hypothetical protein Oweho_3236 [Owenweeksia hongkongensis DSM 17368]
MDIHNTYLVATLSDGTMFKIPVGVIINKLVQDMANEMGITAHQASITINKEEIEDHQVLGYAQMLDYHFLRPDAIQLSRKPGMDFKDGWASSLKEILTQNQIDNRRIEWEVSHD